jgi:uncharacterized protein YsxB (DUF464 family)
MIVAEIYRHKDGKITGFKIEGHANTAPHGKDIYCAGVSTVTQAAYLCIVKHLQRDIEGDSSSGKLELELKTPPDDLTEAVFQTMLIGLREIEKLAPHALKVIE